MHGVIEIPLSDTIRERFKKQFKLLSYPTNRGCLFLRDKDIIGVVNVVEGRNNGLWINYPELNDAAIERHKLDRNLILEDMVSAAIESYGGMCMRIDDENDPLCVWLKDRRARCTIRTNSGVILSFTDPDADRVAADIPESTTSTSSVIALEECLQDVNNTWTLDVLSIPAVKETQKDIDMYLIDRQSSINELYSYAENRGRYDQLRNRYKFTPILERYEEYFDDLSRYISAVLGDERATGSIFNEEDLISEDTKLGSINTKVVKALDIDSDFRSKLFKDRTTIVFPEAVADLEVFISLHQFLNKVYDNFIDIRHRCTTGGTEGLALLNVYGNSYTLFMKELLQKLYADTEYLFKFIKSDTPSSVDDERPYQLI